MKTTRTECPKLLATLATITITIATAGPAFAETAEIEKDEDARQLKLLFQELAIDPEDLTRDSLNKDLIGRPDRYRNIDLTGDLGRDIFSHLGDFAPGLERYRQGFDMGYNSRIDGVGNQLERVSFILMQYGMETDHGSVFIFVVDAAKAKAETDLLFGKDLTPTELDAWLDEVLGENNGEISTWVYFKNGEVANDQYQRAQNAANERAEQAAAEAAAEKTAEAAAEAVADAAAEETGDDEDGERGAFGGNDNDEHGGKAGPLNEFRPLSDGTNGTIRFGKSDPKGGELEGETGSSNSAFATLRFAPGTEERIKSSRVDDYNAGVIAFLNEIMNGGGGFDPSGWDDTENGDGFGNIQGNIGGGSL